MLKMVSSVVFVFIYSSLTFSTIIAENHTSSPIQDANCVLPPYPENGKYTVGNYPLATPGESYPSVKLDVSCDIGYLNENTKNSIFCVNGEWSASIPTCTKSCGTIPPSISSNKVGLPWHAGIYNKIFKPYMQICSGSLVTTTRVISVAHCFWDERTRKLLPADQYAVAMGKLYRSYNEPRDVNSQKSNVVDIKIANGFYGAATNYQGDIAIVIVETPFVYQPFVSPICLDFNKIFDKTQLTDGNVGKAASWNIGGKKQLSEIVDLPYIEIEDCFNISPPNFRTYLTSDKFCAGSNNGTLLCRGDSGGGLAFPEPNGESQRYYLRGVLSVGPTNEDTCDPFNAFTSIMKHEDFIKQYLL